MILENVSCFHLHVPYLWLGLPLTYVFSLLDGSLWR